MGQSGIFVNFNKLEGGSHNKITLEVDLKSILKKVGGGGQGLKVKWRGGYLSLCISP